jgi:hypothetical protein
MIDMHIHSIYSDGQYSPSEIAEMVYKKGIKIFSLTDHDNYKGCSEASEKAKELGIGFIKGIEISTQFKNTNLHILGYNVDFENEKFQKFYNHQENQRNKQKYITIDFLKKRGIQLELSEVESYVTGNLIGRPHFAQAMVDKGFSKDVKEAFDKHLGTDDFKKVQLEKVSSEEAIDVITSCGGIAVLAHPVLVDLSLRKFEPMLKELISYGLSGMECHYGKNTPEQTAYFLAVAKKLNLIHTGGSDFHGERIKPTVFLGTGENNGLYFDEYDYIRKIFKLG